MGEPYKMSKVRTYGGDETGILATSSDRISMERGKDDPVEATA